MRYKIEECVVTGVKNPLLTIIGWVENDADEIVVKHSNLIIEKKTIVKHRSFSTTFNYEIKLDSKINNYDIYILSKDKEYLVKSINTTIVDRTLQKIKPKGYLRGKYNALGKNLKRELLLYNSDVLDLLDSNMYTQWLNNNEFFEPLKKYNYQPIISIVMPVYNVPGEYLSYCIDSILNQTYQNFEICIADDCSTNQDTIDTLKRYMNQDSRIKVIFREKNGHISRATNSALELATGEYIGLMDNDDKLEVHALNEVVSVLNKDKSIDFIYTDEDKIDMDEHRSDPHFKSDFALDTLYGGNYICHFSVIRKSLIEKIGGFRVGYEGSQDFDLFLRLTEVTRNIYHIPKVLYHWRMIPGSTAVGGDGAKNYAGEAGVRALEDYFSKKNIKVNIDNFISTNYFVEYIMDEEPKVLIVLNENGGSNDNCIKSLKDKTLYENYVIKSTDEFKDEYSFRSFIDQRKIDFIVIMDNTLQVETIDWLHEAVGYTNNNHIGLLCGKIKDNFNAVRHSGKVINSEGMVLDACCPTYSDDYGIYGRLLIPYNYNVVNSKMIAFNKRVLNNINYEDLLQNDISESCLKIADRGYNNIFVPQIVFVDFDSKITQNNLVLKKKGYIDNMYNVHFVGNKGFKIEKRGNKLD